MPIQYANQELKLFKIIKNYLKLLKSKSHPLSPLLILSGKGGRGLGSLLAKSHKTGAVILCKIPNCEIFLNFCENALALFIYPC